MTLESLNQKNPFKGPNSSEEFNLRNGKIRKDINQMFELLNKNEENIEENMDIALRENFFLQNQITRLNQEVKKLRGLLEDTDTGGETPSGILLENFYTTEYLLSNKSVNAYIDRTHGVTTPIPTNITSKLSYETETGEVLLPSGLNIFLKESTDTSYDEKGELVYYDLPTEGAKAIADRKKDTFWIRNKSFPKKDSVNEVFGEVHIQLPVEGLNNLYANTLSIHPYPDGTMTIHDVQYKGLGNQWSRLENYPTIMVDGVEQPVPLKNSRKRFFQFGRVEMTEIRIFFSQPYWFEHQNEHIFSYGFQGIDLEYRLYTEKQASFVTKVDVSDKNVFLQRIQEPVAIPAPGTPSNLTNLVSYKLYYDEHLEEEFTFNDKILPQLSTVYVKTILEKQGDVVPAIQQLQIPYLFQERL